MLCCGMGDRAAALLSSSACLIAFSRAWALSASSNSGVIVLGKGTLKFCSGERGGLEGVT